MRKLNGNSHNILMNKILVISDTYYPDSRATIIITTHIAELLSSNYEVYVYPVSQFRDGKYPALHNGVNILLNCEIKWNVYIFLLRIINWTIKKIYDAGCKFTSTESSLSNLISSKKSKVNQYYKRKKAIVSISKTIKKIGIDSIITVSEPFSMHHIGSELKKINKQLVWGAINFDPYSTSQRINKKISSDRYKEECATYRNCDHIFMLSEFYDDYKFSEFSKSISVIHLPITCFQRMKEPCINKSNVINCVYIGGLYKDIRNPQYMLTLFSKLHNENIRLHIYGVDYRDYNEEYFEQWKRKYEGRLFVEGRVSKEKANEIIENADILINIGNTTTNQCPSKVCEYIGTGKPIISLSKTEGCRSAEILSHYPLSYVISENEDINGSLCSKLEEYILSNAGKILDYQVIQKQYPDYSYDNLVNTIICHMDRND